MKLPEDIADTLRRARAVKHLSQRELGERTGVPQSHISKIEKGAVDLRLSSLRAIANALDLEIALVPRKAMPAVKSIARNATGQYQTRIGSGTVIKHFSDISSGKGGWGDLALEELRATLPRPAYRLDDDDDDA